MTVPTPSLVDRSALSLRRARARLDKAGFLHDEAMFEIQERLVDVNRRFTSPAIVTGFPEYWRSLFPQARIVEDAETLDLAPQAHDLVIHAMCLHWSDDPVGQLVQARRALKPDGLFLAVSLGGETLQELRAALGQAEVEISGGLSPRVAPMGELRDMGGLIQRAGLSLPVADAVKKTVTYRSMFHLMHDLRDMGETNVLNTRHSAIPPRSLFARAAELYAENFPAEEKRIQSSFEFVFLSGWAPHESQQKPLRPGSAGTRLADALNTTEFDESAAPVLDRDKK